MASNIHKLMLDGKAIIPATTTNAVLHPETSANLSNLLDCYDVTRIFPKAGIDGGNKYTLKIAIEVLGTALTSEQKLKGVTVKFQDQSGKLLKYEYQGPEKNSSDFIETGNWVNVFNPPIGTVLLSGMGNIFGSDWERCTRIINPKDWIRYYYSSDKESTFGIPLSKVYGGGKIIINEIDADSTSGSENLTGRLLVSSDEGETWETLSIVSSDEVFISLCYFEKTKLYISILVSNINDEQVIQPCYSTDGITWNKPSINPWSNLTGLDTFPYYLIAGENYVVAVGDRKAYITDAADGVNSVWKEESFSFEAPLISFIGTGNLGTFNKTTKLFVFLAGEYIVTRNDNPGGAWEKKGKWSPNSGMLYIGASIFFDSSRDKYVINNLDGIVISTDNTLESWSQVYKNYSTSNNILTRAIPATEDGSIYMAVRLSENVFDGNSIELYKGAVCFSIDGGYTWYENSLGDLAPQNYDNISTPNSIITIVSGGIFKSEIPEIDENGIPYGYIKVR